MLDHLPAVYLQAVRLIPIAVPATCQALIHPWGLAGQCVTVMGEVRCACGQYALTWGIEAGAA